jgi:hypothetical protein
MLTDEQLAESLRSQLHREVATVEPSADLLASLRRRRSRRSLRLHVSIAGLTAVATAGVVAAALLATGGNNGNRPTKKFVLAAEVHQIAKASRHALEHSGRVKITYRETSNGAFNGSGSYDITFSGRNWNSILRMKLRASEGTAFAINRVVDGTSYNYFEGRDGRLRWFHSRNNPGHPKLTVPDPKTLVRLLNPSAKFEIVGHKVIRGLRLTELRATGSPRLPALNGLPGVERGARVPNLTVWVDSKHVVHQMSLRVTQHHIANPIYMEHPKRDVYGLVVPSKAYLKQARAMAMKMRKHHYHVSVRVDSSLSAKVHRYFYVTSVSVTFSEFGKHIVIKAPHHVISQISRG